LSRLITPLK